MVMEEQQPSPQSVGREFVRQYYTLLNKAPNHLHRFYNNNSSFIHGESNLVVGQKNIHSRIQQLNFRDCHAKISQVDAQATLGNGVVVQVTGELSNDGQPMRRFTQTFVLAAQSPKKYYVHNDIFRYQDMYPDEENDGESRSENDEDHEQDQQQQTQVVPPSNNLGVADTTTLQQLPPQQQQQPPQQQQVVVAQPQGQQQTIYYSMPQPVVAGAPRPVPVIAAQTVSLAQFPASAAAQQTQLNGGVVHEDLLTTTMQQQTLQQPVQTPQPLQQQQQQQQQMPPPVQQNVAPTVVSVVPPQVMPQQPPQVAVIPTGAMPPQVVAQMPTLTPTSHSPPLPVMNQNIPVVQAATGPGPNIQSIDSGIMATNSNISGDGVKDEDIGNYNEPHGSPEYIDEQQQIHHEKYEVPKSNQNEPKTYANLFKSSNQSPPGRAYVPSMNQNQINANQPHPQQQVLSSPPSMYKNDPRMIENNLQPGNGGPAPLPQRVNSARINKDFDQRRPGNANSQFNDAHQLFFGNVPPNASEDEVRSIFNRFGHVVELRIHSKSTPKIAGLRNPQNYGFVTYQDAQSVENCLANCPLYYPENSPDGVKLNVEEKKTRARNPNDMSSRPSNNMSGGNNGGNGNNMNNSQRPNMGPNRALSNTGGMMRNNAGNNNFSRGSSGGPRLGGGFNRNESRGPPGSGPQSRGGNGNSGSNAGGGSSNYNRR